MGRPPKKVDWSEIERLYRLGDMSVRSLGRKFGISDQGILQAARRFKWIRNLGARAEARAVEKVAIDKAWVIAELVDNVRKAKAAKNKKDLAAANRALELIGKEIGMFIDRKEVRHGSLDHLSEEELAAYERRIDAELVALGAKGLDQEGTPAPSEGKPPGAVPTIQ